MDVSQTKEEGVPATLSQRLMDIKQGLRKMYALLKQMGHSGTSRASQLKLGKHLEDLSNPGTYSHHQFESVESSYYRTTPDKRNLICKRIKLILMIREAIGFSKTTVEIAVLNIVKGH